MSRRPPSTTLTPVADGTGAYPMSITDGIRDSRFREIIVRPATGLGGQVLLRRRSHRVADYLHDPTISRMIREALPDSKIVIVTAFDSSGEIRDCLVAGKARSRCPGLQHRPDLITILTALFK